MVGNTNIDWQRLQDLERLYKLLEQRVGAIDNLPEQPTDPTVPSAPTNITVSGLTTTSATFSWSQQGVITRTEIYRRPKGGVFGQIPLFSVTGQQASVLDMLPNTEYDYGFVAVSGTKKSPMSIIPLKTLANPDNPNPDPGGPREISITQARIVAAIAAANAAADGSKDAAYNAALRSGLTKGVLADRGATPVVRHVETLSLTSDADGVYISQAGTFVSSEATTIADVVDLWMELQNPSDKDDLIAIPAGPATDATAQYVIGRDWGAGSQVVRSAQFPLVLPKPAFDSQSGGGGGGGSPGTIDFLLSEMVLPHDYPMRQPQIFGVGNGASGVIQQIAHVPEGWPAWDNRTFPAGTVFNRFLPWIVGHSGVGDVNDGSCLLEIWDIWAEIHDGTAWRVMNGQEFGGQGYPHSDPNFALYTSGNGGAGIPVVDPVAWRTITPGRRAFEVRDPTGQNRLLGFHNSVGGGEAVPASRSWLLNTFKSYKVEFKARWVPSGQGTFNWEATHFMMQAGLDPFPTPAITGLVAAGNMSRMKRVTDQPQTFAMTFVRPIASMNIDAPTNPGVANPSVYPPPESWLRANPPPRYTN